MSDRRNRRRAWLEADATKHLRGRRVAGCSGKARYATEAEADRYGALSRGSLESGIKMRSYECPECGRWHVTKHAEDPMGARAVIPMLVSVSFTLPRKWTPGELETAIASGEVAARAIFPRQEEFTTHCAFPDRQDRRAGETTEEVIVTFLPKTIGAIE